MLNLVNSHCALAIWIHIPGFSLGFFRVVQHHFDCPVHHLDHNGMQICTTWVQSKVTDGYGQICFSCVSTGLNVFVTMVEPSSLRKVCAHQNQEMTQYIKLNLCPCANQFNAHFTWRAHQVALFLIQLSMPHRPILAYCILSIKNWTLKKSTIYIWKNLLYILMNQACTLR